MPERKGLEKPSTSERLMISGNILTKPMKRRKIQRRQKRSDKLRASLPPEDVAKGAITTRRSRATRNASSRLVDVSTTSIQTLISRDHGCNRRLPRSTKRLANFGSTLTSIYTVLSRNVYHTIYCFDTLVVVCFR